MNNDIEAGPSERLSTELPAYYHRLKTDEEWEEIWQHFNRMQKRVMHDITTRKEFFAEPEQERLDFYQWMQTQCGSYACYI